jgi:hypothetical protein
MTPPKKRLRFWQGRRDLNFGHAADLGQTEPIRQQTSRLEPAICQASRRFAIGVALAADNRN